jgi:hypothetical protein
MTNNGRVISNMMTRDVQQIGGEVAGRSKELVEDNSLGFNLANLLSDDSLCHLLENEETLLDDFDAFAVADELILLFDYGLFSNQTGEVVGAVEVIEAVEGGNTTPVVERNGAGV